MARSANIVVSMRANCTHTLEGFPESHVSHPLRPITPDHLPEVEVSAGAVQSSSQVNYLFIVTEAFAGEESLAIVNEWGRDAFRIGGREG